MKKKIIKKKENNIQFLFLQFCEFPQKMEDPLSMLTDDWLQFRSIISADWLQTKANNSHVLMASEILHDVLIKVFGIPSLVELCNAKPCIEFYTLFCKELNEILIKKKWSRATSHKFMTIIRLILSKIKVHRGVIRAAKLLPVARSWNKVLGKKFGHLPCENVNRKLLENWQAKIEDVTNNRSKLSMRNIMTFYIGKVLPTFEISVDALPANMIDFVIAKCKDENLIRSICCGTDVMKKLHWLQLFITHIAQADYQIPLHTISVLKKERPKKMDKEADDGSDKHRINTEDLDKLYLVAKEDLVNEMFFMLLLTTGMRIAGYVKMKCQHVADLTNGK